MELEEICKLVQSWEVGAESGLYLQQIVGIVQCRLLLMLLERLDKIEMHTEATSRYLSDEWDMRHNR